MDLLLRIYKYGLLDELDLVFEDYVESYEEADELIEEYDADKYDIEEE